MEKILKKAIQIFFKIIILLTLGAIIYGWGLCMLTTYKHFTTNETDCGEIIAVGTFTKTHKHRTEESPYWVVKFEKQGKKEIHPTIIDYTEFSKGDRVCYDYYPYKGKISEFGIFCWLITAIVVTWSLVVYSLSSDKKK